MHHHQAESGKNEEKGWEWDAVARRRGETEKMRLVGNEEGIIPVKWTQRNQSCMIS